MNKRTILMLLFLFLALLGCKSKKTTVERTKQSDTLITKSFSYQSEPINTNYMIELECDSLGNIKPFEISETSGKNRVDLNIKNNKLNAKLLTGLSRIDIDSLLQASKKERDFDQQKTIYVTDWKTIIIISLCLFISVCINIFFIYNKLKPKVIL